MKQKIILIMALFMLFITGCSSTTKDEAITTKAQNALESHKYTEAMDMLEDILQPSDKDSKNRKLYLQAMRMKKVSEYEEIKDYKNAIEELEKIVKIKGGSSQIAKEASKKKKDLEAVYKEYIQTQQTRKENAKQAAVNGKHANRKKVEELNQQYIKAAEDAARKEEEEKQKEDQNQIPNTNEGQTSNTNNQQPTPNTTGQ